MIAGMKTNEALALARLRQWFYERSAQARAKTRSPLARGWCRRDERTFDARQVRSIDTEKALEALSAQEQAALVYRYAYRDRDEETAKAIGCSVRKLSYLIPDARRKLASAMERLALI